jgi:hypothetical protein
MVRDPMQALHRLAQPSPRELAAPTWRPRPWRRRQRPPPPQPPWHRPLARRRPPTRRAQCRWLQHLLGSQSAGFKAGNGVRGQHKYGEGCWEWWKQHTHPAPTPPPPPPPPAPHPPPPSPPAPTTTPPMAQARAHKAHIGDRNPALLPSDHPRIPSPTTSTISPPAWTHWDNPVIMPRS